LTSKLKKAEPGALRILILGGAGEIGMNCHVYEKDGQVLLIDCGVAFPSDQLLGLELKIPDLRWVYEHKDQVVGIVLTHGHEDHIGAVPFLLQEVDAPVYGTRFTLGLLQEKLDEVRVHRRLKLQEISAGERRQIGNFDLEFIQTSHSIADVVSVALRTEQGIIYHSSDFKLDPTPVDGKRMDLNKLARLGEEGVLAFFSDSTNVEQEGYTPSEKEVGKALMEIFENATGRIIVASFASHIHRVQQVLDAAKSLDRKVLIMGRSMEATTRIAAELGYLSLPGTILVPLQKAKNIPPEKLVVITTGSQGEPLSVLARIARGEHKQLKVIPGDTVVLSSKFIPGNEKAIQNLINDLYRRGAEVFYEKVSEIHCSGHASKEELKLVLSLVRPRYFIPVHGEYRHLVKHKQLAMQMGVKEERCFVVENGAVLEFKEGSARVLERMELMPEFLDANRMRVPSEIIKGRLRLAYAGAVFVSVALDRERNQILELRMRGTGALLEEEDRKMEPEAKARCQARLDSIKGNRPPVSDIENEFRAEMRRFFKARLKTRPMIFVSVINVQEKVF